MSYEGGGAPPHTGGLWWVAAIACLEAGHHIDVWPSGTRWNARFHVLLATALPENHDSNTPCVYLRSLALLMPVPSRFPRHYGIVLLTHPLSFEASETFGHASRLFSTIYMSLSMNLVRGLRAKAKLTSYPRNNEAGIPASSCLSDLSKTKNKGKRTMQG